MNLEVKKSLPCKDCVQRMSNNSADVCFKTLEDLNFL